MVDDPDADTRYNAAVALAQQGNAKAVETLAEMLDFTEPSSVQEEKEPSDRLAKRTLIMGNAMEAAQELAKKNPDADLSEITAALEKLIHADPAELQKSMVNPYRVIAAAKSTLAEVQRRK
jgi:monomeric isocitrate dehydrogenase